MKTRRSSCVALEPEIAASAAGEAAAATERRVREHVDQCRDCGETLARYRRLETEVGGWRERPVDDAGVAEARDRLLASLADLRSRLVSYHVVDSVLGRVLIARSELGIALVEYLPEGGSVATSRLRRFRGFDVVPDGPEGPALGRELEEYVAGRRTRLGWPLDLRFVRTPFQRAVLAATAAIPYGAVVSYKHLALDLGRPGAVRAVAQALRANPLPVAIPCHRVVGTDGQLVGYAGQRTGLKRRLLAAEGVPVVRAGHDFAIAREAMYVLMPSDTEYCVPTCPSTERLYSGLPTFFASRERAEAAGFSPCTACRPDLHPLAELD